ncbi:DUF6377 domain-containing protein [Bacteroides sp. GD17]|jgi:hypothetical protein|uniref:DUF6377 domain-containing protein n=1 Tax=Bacteroides sp. GD17 TaxID=3139826 RepID=UPI0025DAE3A7|nr:DUF6377 domain-containing protein [uncultured Bacteroides sp.]
MKTIISIFCFLFTASVSYGMPSENLDSLYKVLDQTIEKSYIYSEIRENRINYIKTELAAVTDDLEERYTLNKELAFEYKGYMYDSCLHYMNENLKIATEHRLQKSIDESRIHLSYFLTLAGLYKESVDVLDLINRTTLSPDLVTDYYLAYDRSYGELAYYTNSTVSYLFSYREKSNAYKDSLFATLPTESMAYLNLKENDLRGKKLYKEALEVNNERLKKVAKNTPEYSLITYYRAIDYRGLKNIEQAKFWLTESSISDIKAAVKDHASLWMLAGILCDEGDIGRAHKYIRFSRQEVKTYNSKRRNQQSSATLSIINDNYQEQIRDSNQQLTLYLVLISILTLLMAASVVYVNHQRKKLSKARNLLKETNDKLIKLNVELRNVNHNLDDTNKKLSEANARLLESNQIKEEYIGRFLGLCSLYIDKLDNFRKTISKKISNNQIGDVLKLTKSLEFREKELSELYSNFDSAFLHLFPNFIIEFNTLLREDEQIVLSGDEILNTELRIFALIRLGIDDSSKIADFLHYSPNTIYNYRARVKNKSRIPREEFEERIKHIG